jgi:hypothetical protein
MIVTIVNRYNGKCQSCGTKLSAGEGFAYKNGYAWYKVCPSTACMARLGVTPTSAEFNQPKTLSENGVISMPYDRQAITMLRSLPGAKWDPNNKNWVCSVKTGDLPRVLEIADILQLSVPEALRQRCAEGTQESREALQRTFRKRIDGKELYDFQRTGVQFLALHERALLADDQGTGKTIQTLVALPNDSKVILICPAVVKYNWRNEISLWRSEYKVTILEGRNSFKLPEQGEIVILNYDILPAWLSSDIPAETKVILKDTILVADEAHMVKNYKTARSQKITRLAKACKIVWFLTGTPLMTRPQDLYGVISAGNMNVLGGWDKFVSLFGGYKDKFGWRFGMPSAEVPERMKRVMLRRLKSEVLKDLPPKTYKNIEVNNLGTAFYSKINSILSKIDPKEKDIDNLISKLEITSLPSFEEFSQIRALLAEAKIPAMMELVESYEESGTPLIVFSAHKAPVLSLGERDGWGVITGETEAEKRTEIVQKFQNGDLKGIGLTIQAGGVGITLTRASDVLFVDMDWTPALNIQAEDRLHRIGQTSDNILVMRMNSSHPLDIRIQHLIEYKTKLMQKALDESFKFSPPKARPLAQDIKIIEETAEELAERMKAAESEVERNYALSRLQEIAGREAAKVDGVPEPELTPNRKRLLRDALDYMVSVCDGAIEKDGMGFNRPDAFIGHWIFATGLREEDELAFRVLERILCRYRRQLKEEFEVIWKPELEV